MNNLPEEDIFSICQEMDNITLSKFVQTSKENKRICGEILTKREEIYKQKISEILDILDKGIDTEIELKTTNNKRRFILSKYDNLTYRVIEQYICDKSILVINNFYEACDSTEVFERRKTTEDILLYLFRHGHITGYYMVFD